MQKCKFTEITIRWPWAPNQVSATKHLSSSSKRRSIVLYIHRAWPAKGRPIIDLPGRCTGWPLYWQVIRLTRQVSF